MQPDHMHQVIKSRYDQIARSRLSNEQVGVKAVAAAFGYTSEQLAAIPAEANMGLSCGNPTAFASLQPGETVVDLGCGGGLDVLLAAAKVGPRGRAIGIDMTESMIERAWRNAASGTDGKPVDNVEFHLATIENLPLADESVDCVISNCVINLAPDKQAVFGEIARVLKPGGRLAVSDISLKRPLPEPLQEDVLAYVGCIAGAILIDEYRDGLLAAGFEGVEVIDTGADLNAYAQVEAGCCSDEPAETGPLDIMQTGCCVPRTENTARGDEALHRQLADLLRRYDVNEYAASVRVFAVKPR
jgi:arsenite methyltransferase